MRKNSISTQPIVLLSLVHFMETVGRLLPRVPIDNWLNEFRELRTKVAPHLSEADFWDGLYELMCSEPIGNPLGQHSVPLHNIAPPNGTRFLHSIHLHNPVQWSNALFLKTTKQKLWEEITQNRPMIRPFTEVKDHFPTELVFPDAILRSVYIAFHAVEHKRFVILSGLSGTGKTKMLEAFATAYLKASNLQPSSFLCKLSVAPDWRDPSALLGYINPLTKPPSFMVGKLTKLLLHAVKYPVLPHFLILDEMNLARVEKYFAPFLSAMETPTLPVRLHDFGKMVDGIPTTIEHWPKNLFIGCTINMDETTHAISDKVLDRAFTIEFWEADLQTFFSKRSNSISIVEQTLIQLYKDLSPVNCHFGYRTANEVCSFVEQAFRLEGDQHLIAIELLDQAIYAKVLPKIRGQKTRDLEDALQNAYNTCQRYNLLRSAGKIQQLISKLNQFGMTRFWT